MRHRRAGWKLGRNTEHRRALLRNLVTSLIVEERIETTLTKAKAMRPHVDKMITLGKRGDVAARRLAGSYLMTRDAVDKRFDTISTALSATAKAGYSRLPWRLFRFRAMVAISLSSSCSAARRRSTRSARSAPNSVPSAPKRVAKPWSPPSKRTRPWETKLRPLNRRARRKRSRVSLATLETS